MRLRKHRITQHFLFLTEIINIDANSDILACCSLNEIYLYPSYFTLKTNIINCDKYKWWTYHQHSFHILTSDQTPEVDVYFYVRFERCVLFSLVSIKLIMTSTEKKICKQCASYEDKIRSIQLIIPVHNIKFGNKEMYKDVIFVSSPTPPVALKQKF